MAPRPAWKGYLKLSLVSCAVELTSATDHSEKVSFRVINRKTGNTVRRQYIDSVSGKPVDSDDEVKGYEIGGDEYLLIEEDEIDAVQIESSHTLSIEQFVDRAAIPQIYFDQPHYLSPSDEISEEAFAVIREAMAKQRKAGIARIVLYRRERPVMIEPFDKGLLLTTLRYDKTVRQPDEVFDGLRKGKLDEELVDLATHIIEKKQATFDPSGFEDRYEEALLDLIEAKRKGKKPPVAKPAERPSNVVNLFEALKKSLGEEGGSSRKSSTRDKKPAGTRKPTKKPAAGKAKKSA
ncbi:MULTISPECIES: Ku protein [unclassified Bosea (in: a-proteobacteria)]|uniref:non-homologous end joining protein Ku n=1 Tax=unclassified Bosea (in: a-proteobacteria) TaxID=2653178 RepID=UPI000F74F498|nr:MULTISPECIES: Ku protein [unclassified Bosea (in: a-proteobacteria)]AZO79843.1 Ku protein [Bosea sp. Tri-49]RXT15898.1 Ku protein [Bosea sp. Tri-39]RXT39590.1 Ku protein [Bosea sp. Tri-54]